MAPKQTQSATVILVSQVDHPMTLSYAGDALILAPRGTSGVLELNQLGALPKGIAAIPQQ